MSHQKIIHSIFTVIAIVLCASSAHAAPSDPLETTVKTADDHAIVLDHHRNGFTKVVILAHGFYNNKDTVLFKKLARMFRRHYDVISFDFRGHGKSEGLFAWTAEEEQDLRAVVSYASENEYDSIGVIGFSLGAAIAIIEAADNPLIDSVIAVSSPYDFWQIDYHFWEEMMLEDLKLNLGPKGEGKGIRPGNPFLEKTRPIDVVDRISPTPILFIHGKKDWLINTYHSERLFDQAGQPKDIYIFEKGGHAEKIFDDFPDRFEEICFEWFERTL